MNVCGLKDALQKIVELETNLREVKEIVRLEILKESGGGGKLIGKNKAELLLLTLDEFFNSFQDGRPGTKRVLNALKSSNIITLSDLTERHVRELLKYRDLGRLSLKLIEYRLSSVGLSLLPSDFT